MFVVSRLIVCIEDFNVIMFKIKVKCLILFIQIK